jgi:hypothetical protein
LELEAWIAMAMDCNGWQWIAMDGSALECVWSLNASLAWCPLWLGDAGGFMNVVMIRLLAPHIGTGAFRKKWWCSLLMSTPMSLPFWSWIYVLFGFDHQIIISYHINSYHIYIYIHTISYIDKCMSPSCLSLR